MKRLLDPRLVLTLAVWSASCNDTSQVPKPQPEISEEFVSNPYCIAFDLETLAMKGDTSA